VTADRRLFKYHVENLRLVDTAIESVGRELRAAVARNDEHRTEVFLRLKALLLSAWAEARLAKLLHEPAGFTSAEREQIRQKGTHIERWLEAIEVATRRHYGVAGALNQRTLRFEEHARYQSLSGSMRNRLQPIIELRNKLAHGQWAYPLNTEGTAIAQDEMDALRTLNALKLYFIQQMIVHICDAVHDLAVSRATFERDFQRHHKLLEQAVANFDSRDYERWALQQRESWKRGRDLRAEGVRHATQ
jgi:hypothetical protein